MLADGLAPNGARPSASTELTTKLNMSSFHFLWLSYFQITFWWLLHYFIQNGHEDLPKSHQTLTVGNLFGTPSLNMPVMSHDHQNVSNCLLLHCLFNNFPWWATKETSKPYSWPFERGNHWCLVDLPHIGTSNAKVIVCPLVVFHIKGQQCGKCFHVITSSWQFLTSCDLRTDVCTDMSMIYIDVTNMNNELPLYQTI